MLDEITRHVLDEVLSRKGIMDPADAVWLANDPDAQQCRVEILRADGAEARVDLLNANANGILEDPRVVRIKLTPRTIRYVFRNVLA